MPTLVLLFTILAMPNASCASSTATFLSPSPVATSANTAVASPDNHTPTAPTPTPAWATATPASLPIPSPTTSPIPVLPSSTVLPTASPVEATSVVKHPQPAAVVSTTLSNPPIRSAVPVSPDEVSRGDSSRPWVSLVFNAGAGYQSAASILDVLQEKGIRTTFFLMGWWAAKEPKLVARIVAEGHEVASHGHQVFDLTEVSDEEVIADLERADEVIKGITGVSTKPLWSASAGYRDNRVRRLAARLRYRPIYWTVDSGDWREDATASRVRERVLAGAVNGAIIVMHSDSPRTADTIVPALPGIVDDLRGRGFRLVTVSELITGQLASGEKDQ